MARCRSARRIVASAAHQEHEHPVHARPHVCSSPSALRPPHALAAALARDLTVVARGNDDAGCAGARGRLAVHRGHRLPVQLESWDGGLDTLRSQLKAPDSTWDLVEVNAEELATGCSEGLFEKLDWSAIGGKDHYLAAGRQRLRRRRGGHHDWCWRGIATSSPPRLAGRISGTWRNIRASAACTKACAATWSSP